MKATENSSENRHLSNLFNNEAKLNRKNAIIKTTGNYCASKVWVIKSIAYLNFRKKERNTLERFSDRAKLVTRKRKTVIENIELFINGICRVKIRMTHNSFGVLE